MTTITPLHIKHTLIARTAAPSSTKRIANAIVDRFRDTEVTTAMRAAAVLDASDYPQVAYQVRQGNLGMLDIVRPLL